MFSEKLQTVLRQQGWFPERCVSIDREVALLEREGFTVLPEAERVLSSFYGLTIRPVRTSADVYANCSIKFSPGEDAVGEYEFVETWEGIIHQSLTPIGVTLDRYILLLLAADGRIFQEWDGYLFEYGSSFVDAMEHSLVFASRLPTKRICNAFGNLRQVELWS